MNIRACAVAAVVGVGMSGCAAAEPAGTWAGRAAFSESSSSVPPAIRTPVAQSLRIAAREESAAGPAPTVADYIAERDIRETPVRRGDPGAPVVDLPVPAGWVPAGDQTPGWAYSAIAYAGPGAAAYQPSIVAMMSRLTGNVDPQRLIELAPGEVQNLPGWSATVAGEITTLGGHPAVELGGTWTAGGLSKLVVQKTVVIFGSDAVYLLELDTDALAAQAPIIAAATADIDAHTTVSF